MIEALWHFFGQPVCPSQLRLKFSHVKSELYPLTCIAITIKKDENIYIKKVYNKKLYRVAGSGVL